MDIEELADLIAQHGKAIYGFCWKLAGNPVDADDLYQETFLRAVEGRHTLDKTRNPKAYLIAIAVGLHRNHRRKQAWRQRIAPVSRLADQDESQPWAISPHTPEDAALSREQQALLRQAAHQLKDKLRLPLYMYYTAELSVEEIASALRIPQGTVKSRLHKARQLLRKAMEVGSRT